MSKLAASIFLILISLGVLWVAQRYGDRPAMLVNASCGVLPNPCVKIDCNRPPKRNMT